MTTGVTPVRARGGSTVSKRIARLEDRDLVAQLTRALRLESTLLCRSVMAAPWGFGVPGRDAGSFHLVVAGDGWLEVDGFPEPIRVRAGDVCVLPHGDGHRVRDSTASPAPSLSSILAENELENGELHFGGATGPMTEIVCGTFTVEGGRPPWFQQLPSVVISNGSSPRSQWRRAIVAAVSDEVRSPSPGGVVVVNRWLESLIANALHAELSTASTRDAASAAALEDERIGRVVSAIQHDPAAAWTLARMARHAAMSRSTFAARFLSLVKETPARYVTRIRLELAERLLRATDATVADIAHRVGYGSEESLSRAFKARFGAAPSLRRRARRCGDKAGRS
jgi:AraC-like DNA-binding protein